MRKTEIDAKKDERLSKIEQTTIEDSKNDNLDRIEVLEVILQHSNSDFSTQNFEQQQHFSRISSDKFEAEKVAAMRSLKTNLCLLAISCFLSLITAKVSDIYRSYLFSLMLKLDQTFKLVKF